MSGVMKSYLHDWYWADQYLPQIKVILALNAIHLLEIETASPDEDTKEATDIIVKVSGGKVAVRIRKPTPKRDLTLRCWRASGVKTELQKIKEGFCRWYLYVWTNRKGKIQDYILVDLNKLRESKILNKSFTVINNFDGETGFIAIPYTDLEAAGCIVSKWLVNS